MTYLDKENIQYTLKQYREELGISFLSLSAMESYDRILREGSREPEETCKFFEGVESSESLTLHILESHEKVRERVRVLESIEVRSSGEESSLLFFKHLYINILLKLNMKNLEILSYPLDKLKESQGLGEYATLKQMAYSNDYKEYLSLKKGVEENLKGADYHDSLILIQGDESYTVVTTKLQENLRRVEVSLYLKAFKVAEILSIAKDRLEIQKKEVCCIKKARRDLDRVLSLDREDLENTYKKWVKSFNYALQRVKNAFIGGVELKDNTLREGLGINPKEIYATIASEVSNLAKIDLTKANYPFSVEATVYHNVRVIIGEQLNQNLKELFEESVCRGADLTESKPCTLQVGEGGDISEKELEETVICLSKNVEGITKKIDRVSKAKDNILAKERLSDIENTTRLPENDDYYKERVDRDKSYAQTLKEETSKINQSLGGILSNINNINRLVNGRLEINLEEVEALQASLKSLDKLASKVMDALCKMTKLECMAREFLGTAYKTAEEIGGTAKDLWEVRGKIWEKLSEMKVTFDSSTTLKVGGSITNSTKSVVYNAVNNIAVSYVGADGKRIDAESHGKISEALAETYKSMQNTVKTEAVKYKDCSWAEKSEVAEGFLEEYFEDSKRNLDNCEGESLVNLPDILNIDWDDINLSLNINLDLNKPRCKR